MKTIFVVDDSDTNLAIAEEALEGRYTVMTIPSAAKMFSLLEKVTPDLILLDIEMPEMNGFEALKHLKAHNLYRNIPVIFLTASSNDVIEAMGFEVGAVDFITKPFSTPVLLNRIKMHLNIEGLIRERTAQLLQLQNGIVSTISDMVEKRDKTTGGHIIRTTAYIKILLTAMVEYGVYAEEIRNWNFELVISSARLHDVGKIVISDFILNKPGLLNDDEYELIKTHSAEGEGVIDQMIARTGEVEFLYNAKMFAGYHHERWDGTGYPRGLKGTEIPLQGRIMALADVYDALLSVRPYKESFTFEDAENEIMSKSGQYFDPDIVGVFSKTKDLFREVSAVLHTRMHEEVFSWR